MQQKVKASDLPL